MKRKIGTGLIFIFLVVLMGWHVMHGINQYEEEHTLSPTWVNWRIQPVGETHIQFQDTAISIKEIAQIVRTQCGVCHVNGAYQAPRLNRQDDWRDRQSIGLSKLVHNTIHGKGHMPPRGGFDLTDTQIRQSVLWMMQTLGIEVSDAMAKESKNKTDKK